MGLKQIVKFSTLLILLIICTTAESKHIVGGDVTYKFLMFNVDSSQVTFEIDFTMYRDKLSNGATFDNDASFGLYRRNGSGWTHIRTIVQDPTDPRDVTVVDDPCVEEPVDQVAVEEATYSFEITVDVISEDYMIAYQRCCRNDIIRNIINPGDAGAAFDVIITPEAQLAGNNSPVFNQFPPLFICAGFEINVDHSARDSESNRLRYSFCAPFTAGGPTESDSGCCTCIRPNPRMCIPNFVNVRYLAPFSATNPLGGDPIVTIDPLTGFITGIPEETGTYVVGVCVQEFDDQNRLLSEIRRDFQFTVLVCARTVIAEIESDSEIRDPNEPDGVKYGNNRIFLLQSCGDLSVDFDNASTDERFIVDYKWEVFDSNDLLIHIEQGLDERDQTVDFPGIGEYSGLMIINEGLDCADTAPFVINLYPAIDADYSFSYDTCIAGPVLFRDASVTGGERITEWEWDFDDGNMSSEINPEHVYNQPGFRDTRLTVTDNNECKDDTIIPISYFPVPQLLVVEPSKFIGCNPADVFFNNLSEPIDSNYIIEWDFGDGTFGTEISPTHQYLDPGTYSVSLEITSPDGICSTSRDFDSYIQIKESPIADFSFSPEEPNVLSSRVSFFDNSQFSGAWQWNFGGVGNAFVQNPSFDFPDTGIYEVLLTVFHPVTNCVDTITQLVDVSPVVRFRFPNAFTPNGDSKNDRFLGNGYYDGLNDYRLTIWNRWGQMIFETDDPREGWNGQEYNTGKESPQGVYVYQATYLDPRGRKLNEEGHVTLLR